MYRKDDPAAVATLARLRRGVGQHPYDSPGTWGIDGLEELARLREREQWLASSGTKGSEAPPKFFSAEQRRRDERRMDSEEGAVHLAVTLWALHQQSIGDANMHDFEWPLGRAVRRLAEGKAGTGNAGAAEEQGSRKTAAHPDDGLSEALRKRFVCIGTANSFDSLSIRLREMVLLLRTARIPLDYGRLAGQLCSWQDERRRSEVRRAWGREFHLAFGDSARARVAGQAAPRTGAPEAASSPGGQGGEDVDQGDDEGDFYGSGE
ncbi:type I-E CRISPR-associated protein Cse2/CasB [Streptomyces sp. ISL-11]|uniref:type I-E CRISPR-associated protein Cse2/CasB n=1 Tax=Streptomyces sp. ISL-11 TaxID=2819174 RepID=UPI001BE8B8F7|nr:type I-E CRISPR-associated protein Cse2/CasB [Streptomyces sp. ISL-11]MBT2384070.1 type I-E CRISPR-associated protein Cse2/CasB [Streptomyces sp. ISL-11]